MTPAEFRAELAGLGVTQTWLADRLKVKRQVVSRWATNASPVPSWMPFLLELLRERMPLAEMPEAQLRQAAARESVVVRYPTTR